jgi:hypothetical protein
MKSCRNCNYSRHTWGYNPALECPVYDMEVAPTSKNTEENVKADQRCRSLAARCPAYTPEGESK